MQLITHYKAKPAVITDPDPNFPDELNKFYCRFDNSSAPMAHPSPSLPEDATPSFVISEHKVRNLCRP